MSGGCSCSGNGRRPFRPGCQYPRSWYGSTTLLPILPSTGRERGSCIGYMSSPRNEDEVHAISSSIPEGEAFGLQAWNGHGSAGRWQWTLCGVCLSTMGPRCLCSSLWICGPCPALILLKLHGFAIISKGTARTSTHIVHRVDVSSKESKGSTQC